jgi:glycosyltransferase involved in cell wall biosynthesis
MSSQGSKIGYEPNAIINHIVSEDRLQSHWFLRRFAWQGVSDSLSEKLNNFEWNRRALDYHAENLGIKKFVDELLADDYKDLEDRAKFARYFIFELLNTESHSPTAPPNMSPFLPVKPNTSHLVFDYEHFHDFLAFTLPSDSITVVTSKYSPYELSTSEFERIVNDLRLKSLSSSKPLHLIILTVDNLLNQSLFPIFQRVFNSYEKVTVCLHRMPNANEKSLLSKLQNRARILVFSKTVEDSLKNEDMNVRYIPIPIRKLNYELNLQTLEESKHTQIAVAGEFRSQKQMQYLTSIIDYLKNRSILVTFKLIGGIKSAEMLRDIAKISELNPGYIHEDNLVRINGEYKVIDSVSYYREIANSDVLLKLQFEEYAAGSAVVADALALGIPIMTLKDTESSRTVEKFFSNLIIDPTNHHTFVSALDLVRKYDKVPNLDFNLKVTEEFVNILLDRG